MCVCVHIDRDIYIAIEIDTYIDMDKHIYLQRKIDEMREAEQKR